MIRFQTLGSVSLTADGQELTNVLAQPKRLALLAFLATARPVGFQSRDRLLALFWPESDTAKARNSLRQALHQLRRALGDDAIVTRGERDVGVDPAVVECDAARFDSALAERRDADALALYHGDFVPGLHVQEADDANRWFDDERIRRRRDAAEAARRLITSASQAGDLNAALMWARRGVALEPTDESAVRRLLEVQAELGDAPGAMSTFSELSRRLEAEFGIRPSRELAKLVQEIGERPAATTAEMAALSPRKISPPSSAGRGAPVDPEGRPGFAPEREPLGGGVGTSAATTLGSRQEPLSRGVGTGKKRGRLVAAVAATMAIAAVALFARSIRDKPIGGADAPSIAVLPFVNLSGDPGNEYLSDGMTEELLNLLARVPGLRVAARTSAFSFKDSRASVDSIGRALRVRHVLEGSVRRNGDTWRVTAQLIDAATGYHVWSENFETKLGSVVSLQDQISREIVERLRGDLKTGGDAPRREPPNPEAMVATMKGWRAFRLNSREGYAAAVGLFEDAIRRDPNYGYAHAGLATVRHWQAALRFVPADSGYDAGLRSASRALALDSSLVDGWLILGRTAEVRDRDFVRAEEYYRRAIAIAPSDPRGYSRRASMLARLGRTDEALRSATRAVELDPASPAVHSDLANLYGDLNRFEDAEQSLRRALALDPGHPILLGNLALNLAHQKRYAGADSIMALLRVQNPDDPTLMGQHSFILANLGQSARARALVDSAARAGLSRVNLASTLLALGDTGAALAQLERAFAERDDGLTVLLDTTMFAGLRTNARYVQLVASVRSAFDR